MQCLECSQMSLTSPEMLLRWSSRPDLVLVCVESLFVLVTLSQAAYYYADIAVFLFHQCCQQVVN